MKKTKYVALVLVAAIMLMGAGYAYWSDAVKVNSTVDTGEFNVEFVDGNKYPLIKDVEYMDTDAETSNNAKVTTLTISKLYPGAEVTYELEVKNLGTIPAVFDYSDIEFIGSDNLKACLIGKMGLSYGSPVKFVGMDQLENSVDTNLLGLRLEPGESKIIKASFKLPDTVDNDDKVELKTLKVKFTLNWTQHNDPAVIPAS